MSRQYRNCVSKTIHCVLTKILAKISQVFIKCLKRGEKYIFLALLIWFHDPGYFHDCKDDIAGVGVAVGSTGSVNTRGPDGNRVTVWVQPVCVSPVGWGSRS